MHTLYGDATGVNKFPHEKISGGNRHPVDRMADLKARIAVLQAEFDELRERLIASDFGPIGAAHAATISHFPRRSISIATAERMLPRDLFARIPCIIHPIRNSLAFVSWTDRKQIMPDLKAVYRAETAEMAAAELDHFEAVWGKRYPAIGQAWRRAWDYVVPLFAFPPAIRKMIYTGNNRSQPNERAPRSSYRLPMPWKACIGPCARSSRPAAASRPTRRP